MPRRIQRDGLPRGGGVARPGEDRGVCDRPARLATTARARAFAEDFAADFAGDPPNVAVTGWRKRRKGGWRRAYAVVTATGVAFDAAAGELRYAVVQFPGQAGATKGFSRGGGVRKEALRFCAGFVDDYGQGATGKDLDEMLDNLAALANSLRSLVSVGAGGV